MKKAEDHMLKCVTGHEWEYREYYCGYADGYSQRSFACGSCGDRPTCGGQLVRRVCLNCGAKEWVYPEDIHDEFPRCTE